MFTSSVEKRFHERSGYALPESRIPYITVCSFPELGLLTALRFLEWSSENPEGVVSLPTGKTPEYFIKWTNYLLLEWQSPDQEKFRKNFGLGIKNKPDLRGLHFVQIDEFYPINPVQHNSFNYYVNKYYVEGFGLDQNRAQLINCQKIPRPQGLPFEQIFPNDKVDLTLRTRECRSREEELQRDAVLMVDEWCAEYEERIRQKGGIGFFLGGIGPDGHIAFNVRGSDHNSTTRLTDTNFETQAAAATDLGGIEISRSKLVITIGLATITFNPEVIAIIMAAGEAKAGIVANSVESKPSNLFPATALHKLTNSRFYLTQGAASRISTSMQRYYQSSKWSGEKTERAIIDLCKRENIFGHRLEVEDLQKDKVCDMIPNKDGSTVSFVIKSLQKKIQRGLTNLTGEVFLHTGPHHDDIMLGYLPFIVHLIRSPKNTHHFSIFTSGFTSVTNNYLLRTLRATKTLLIQNRIEMIMYPDFFESGYRLKWDKDIFHYLDRVAARNREGQTRGLSHRVIRVLVEIYDIKDRTDLLSKIDNLITYLEACYDGEKNSSDVQHLKGRLREFEEELVWAHYGVQVENVHHLRLGFYSGDIFNKPPDRSRDVAPVLDHLRTIKPTILTLALDPEGSGPDTHYKALQTLAEAVRVWRRDEDLSNLRIWGYRNVWYRFHPAEADIIVPVSLNSMSVLRETFLDCYVSQREASFPSHELDGPFCELVQKIWVEQHQLLELVLGRDYWYQNKHPRLRATHGVLYLREMDVDTFLGEARRLEESMERQIEYSL
ncbi:MAG: glucosamine-6-phosphate isomerase [Fidelibacterota bacterium]